MSLEFPNEDLIKIQPEFFYRITEYVTTFGEDAGKNEPYCISTNFEGIDLLKCRNDAYDFYIDRCNGLRKEGKYFLPFAAPENFVIGKNAAYSVELSFVEYYDEDDQTDYIIAGSDEMETEQAREEEEFVLKKFGLI